MAESERNLEDEETTPDFKIEKQGDKNSVMMTANSFWDKINTTEEEKIDRFSHALENMQNKRKEGSLNIIDQRLIEILSIYDV